MTELETVCFDLDNTLCIHEQDDSDIHDAVFERVDREPPFTVEDVQAVDPATLPEVESDVAFYENLYQAVTDELEADVYRELAEATVEIIDPTAVRFRDGAQDTLAYAREHYTVGLLTQGSDETQTAKLEALGICDHFEAVVVCGGTELAGKPDPEPFTHVLDELAASPESSLYVGDSLRGDIGGANTVGMQSAWLPLDEMSENPEPEPDYLLDSHDELLDIL